MGPAEDRFEAMVRAHHDDLLRFAVRRVGRDCAPDVVADVFLVAWRRRTEVPLDAERLWLFGVAHRTIANERRGHERRMRLVAKVAGEIRDPDDGRDPASDAVLEALAGLPPHEQEALRLTEWDGLTLAEAAVVAGCSHATFRVRVHRARRRLARLLDAVERPARSRPTDRHPVKDVTA